MDTKLFGRNQPGGLFSIVDREHFPTGDIWWVGSEETAAEDGAGFGRNPDAPFATLAYAIDLVAAGDTMFLMPGHNEGLADAQIDIAVAGLRIIGLGTGTLRPRIDFDHGNASINVGACNVEIRNIRLQPAITTVLIGIDVEAAMTDCKLIDIELMDGEDGAGADEFSTGIEFKAGCDRGLVQGLIASSFAGSAPNYAVLLKGASDSVVIRDCVIRGPYAIGCIGADTTLSTKLLIQNCILQPLDAQPGISVITLTTGIVANCCIATDLATKAAAIEGVGGAHAFYLFENYYCEVVGESGGLIGTASADD
ncbi:MAG TPA: hypothetical protein VMW52_02135 [Phycisphaerae bacterium]|nr:hypothetical protein [Phycisphaerae bacterium]